MAWVDWNFYIEIYLMSDNPAIPEHSFPRWASKAQDVISAQNMSGAELLDPSEVLKRLTCELAELLYQNAQAPKPGDVKSESNAGYSYTLETAKATSDTNAEVQRLISKRLAFTELHNLFVYRGVK